MLGVFVDGRLSKRAQPPKKPKMARDQGVGERFYAKSREAALVDPDLNIAIPHTLEIDHRRCDVAVAHPLLQRADIDAVLQVAGGGGVAELVKELSSAERPLPAAVDADSAVFQLVSRGAMTALEFPPVCDSLEL